MTKARERKTYGYTNPVLQRLRERSTLRRAVPQTVQNRDDQEIDDIHIAGVVATRGLPSFLTRAAPKVSSFDDHTAPDTLGDGVIENAPSAKTRKVKRSGPVIRDGIGSDVDAGGADRKLSDTHSLVVSSTTPSRTRKTKAKTAVVVDAGGEIDHTAGDTQCSGVDLANTIADIRDESYQLRRLVTQRVATINRAKEICRHAIATIDPSFAGVRGKKKEELSKAEEQQVKHLKDKAGELYDAIAAQKDHPAMRYALASVTPMILSVEQLKKAEDLIEKRMEKLAKTLPCAAWIKAQKGISLVSFAKVIGYTGDLNRFQKETGGAAPAKLWKYMEVGLVLEHGADTPVCQQRRSGAEGLTHSYAGQKRSLMWNIGNGLIGGMGNPKRPRVGEDLSTIEASPLERLFMERLRYLAGRDPKAFAREPVERKGEVFESFSARAARDSKRYVEKRFLKLLYLQWRKETGRDHALDPEFEMAA